MHRTRWIGGTLLAALVGGAYFAGVASAAKSPVVLSVIEGRASGDDAPVLVLLGAGLKKLRTYELRDGESALVATPFPTSRNNDLVVLALPAGLDPGTYTLAVADKRGDGQEFPVRIGNGSVLAGSVDETSLSSTLRSDLDDASTLGGQGPTYFTAAGNLTGTVPVERFSAHDDLVAEGRIGPVVGQVAAGDHAHEVESASDSLVGARVLRTNDEFGVSNPGATIPWDGEDFDTDASHDPSSDSERLVCTSPGYYLVTVRIVWSLADDGLSLAVWKNGEALVPDLHSGSGSAEETVSVLVYLDVDDYLEAHVSATGAIDKYVLGGDESRFWMVRLGG